MSADLRSTLPALFRGVQIFPRAWLLGMLACSTPASESGGSPTLDASNGWATATCAVPAGAPSRAAEDSGSSGSGAWCQGHGQHDLDDWCHVPPCDPPDAEELLATAAYGAEHDRCLAEPFGTVDVIRLGPYWGAVDYFFCGPVFVGVLDLHDTGCSDTYGAVPECTAWCTVGQASGESPGYPPCP